MNPSPHTRPSLLVRLRDTADHEAWCQLVELYAPLVYRFLRRRGLQDADAADLTQEVLRAVAGAIDRFEYDSRRGSFRGWLFTVARNKLHSFLKHTNCRRRHIEEVDDERLRLEPAPVEEAELWEQEFHQRLFDWAAEQVRGQFVDTTWQAFWRTAVEGRPPREVAAELSLSVGAVYIARSRVLARLKEEVQRLLEEESTTDEADR
jgi:RNA polymerase sigma-70 factor (ECF subfamily)